VLVPRKDIPVEVPAVLIVYVPLAVVNNPAGIVNPAKDGPDDVAPPANADGLMAYCLAITPRLFKSDVMAFLFESIAVEVKRLIPTTMATPPIITPSTIKSNCCCPILLPPQHII
jgi:hypothetical protein